ncbi:hypothetical protein PG988_004859 [Apiospora saccharicola]
MDSAMDPSMLPNKIGQADALVNISFVFTAISALIVFIRATIRDGIIKKTGADDILVFISMLFLIGYLICNTETLLKLTYAIEILYYVIIVTTKCSIVAMYYNIALTRILPRGLLHDPRPPCQPLSRQWDPTLAPAARAASGINTTAFFYFASAFNIVMDFWILGMPLKTLNALQIRRRNRYVLYGVFATAMSCVRLYSIYTYTLAADPFMEGSLINVWSMIEINVGIICASVPALKPLFTPKVLLARARGQDPDAPAVRVHSGNSGSERNRHYQKKSANIRTHSSGAGSEATLSASMGRRDDDDTKQPRTSGIAIRMSSMATSRKHLVEGGSVGDDDDDDDENNAIELQWQTPGRG